MDTPTTGGPCENGNPQVAAAKKKRCRPLTSKKARATSSVQWCSQRGGLPQEALAFARANYQERALQRAAAAPSPAGAAEQATPRTEPAAEAGAAAAPPKRDHKARVIHRLPHLPAGFTAATDRVGALHATTGEDGQPRRPERPLKSIVCEGPKDDIFAAITADPTNKTERYNNKFTPAQKLRAEEYSRTQGYHSAEGAPPPAPAPQPHDRALPEPRPPRPAGAPDYQAVVRDALNGKMVPRTSVHRLALGYEKIIADTKKQAGPPACRQRPPAEQAQPKRLHKRKARVGEAPAPPLAGRGCATGDVQTEGQQASAVARQSRRRMRFAFQAVGACSDALGGVAALTTFFVFMLLSAVKKTGRHKKNIFFKSDIVGQVLDDPALFKAFGKEIDKRRKPPISQFVIAHLTGVTYTAMDKLRFATAWCPGHSTLLGEIKRLEAHIEATWCPSGPTAGHGTTRTAAEQAAAAAEAAREAARDGTGEANGAGAPDLNDQELDSLGKEAAAAIAAARPEDAQDAAEHAAEDRQKQGLALLGREFPDDTEQELWDRWAGGMDEEQGVFVGGNIIYVMAVRGGKLLGFVKALRTKTELFVDEVLVAEEERGPQGLCTHMFRKLAMTVAGRQRLQVKEAKEKVIQGYQRLGYTVWNSPRVGAFEGVEPDDLCMFMAAARQTVLNNSKAFCIATPLAEGTQLLVCAAMPITGTTFDHVGKPAAEAQGPPPPETDADGRDDPMDGPMETETEVEVDEETVTDPNTDAGKDDDCDADTVDKVAESWGASSVSSATATMLNGTTHAPMPLSHLHTPHAHARSRVSQRCAKTRCRSRTARKPSRASRSRATPRT